MNEFQGGFFDVPNSAAHVLHAAMQFLVALRRRWQVFVAILLGIALLGALYYATATRRYRSAAEVLILQTSDTLSTRIESQSSQDNTLMPTFVSLMTSAKVLEGAIRALNPEDLKVDLVPDKPERWVDGLRKNLDVKVMGRSNVISVEYTSRDPAVAARVVNAVVQSYLEFMRNTTQGTAAEIVHVLTTEKDEITIQLSAKEQQLQDLSQQIGALDVGVNSQTVHPLIERAKAFNAALVEAQKTRVELAASLQAMEQALRQGQDIKQYLLTTSDTVGQQLLLGVLGLNREDSNSRTELERQLLQDRIELARIQEYLGNNHARVQALQERILATESYLQNDRERIAARLEGLESDDLKQLCVGSLRQQLAEKWQRELSLQAQYEEARQQAAELAGGLAQLEMLKNDIASLRDLYTALVRRITNLDLAGDVKAAVITEPQENPSPVSPSLARVILMVIFGGLALGLGVVYALDVLDDRFRSAEEIQWQLRAPVLSVVREMPARSGQGIATVEVVAEPESVASEAFRTLRTALALSETPSSAVVITSTEPGDGKSTVAANLAVAYAQAGKRTLLIDADLRRPGLTSLLDLRSRPGLTELLRSREPVAESVASFLQNQIVLNLDVLPSGSRPVNPAELLSGARLAELIQWAGGHYDQIVIDSPPAPLASDTAILGRLADGVVLVLQPEKNKRRPVLRAAEYLSILKIPLLGLVINRISGQQDEAYAGYGGAYYGKDAESEAEADQARSGDAAAESGDMAPDHQARQTRIHPRRVA